MKSFKLFSVGGLFLPGINYARVIGNSFVQLQSDIVDDGTGVLDMELRSLDRDDGHTGIRHDSEDSADLLPAGTFTADDIENGWACFTCFPQRPSQDPSENSLQGIDLKEFEFWKEFVTIDDSSEHGAVLRVLYVMAAECEESKSTVDLARFTWGDFARPAFFSIVSQAGLLWLLGEIIDGDNTVGLEEWQERWPFLVVAASVLTWDVFTFFTGPSMRCLYCIVNTNFKNHKFWPTWSRLFAWFLYICDLGIGVTTGLFGLEIIMRSVDETELLANVVALHYILDVDDYVAKLTPNIGMCKELSVPKRVVMPDDVFDWPTKGRTPSGVLDTAWFQEGWRFVAIAYIVHMGFVSRPWVPVSIATAVYIWFECFDCGLYYALIPIFLLSLGDFMVFEHQKLLDNLSRLEEARQPDREERREAKKLREEINRVQEIMNTIDKRQSEFQMTDVTKLIRKIDRAKQKMEKLLRQQAALELGQIDEDEPCDKLDMGSFCSAGGPLVNPSEHLTKKFGAFLLLLGFIGIALYVDARLSGNLEK